MHKADAVFEGGGVKGIALLGALSVMEEIWDWQNVAGTSAGAIVAAFTTAGMSAGDIRAVPDRIDLTELMDTGWEEKLDWFLSRLSPIRLIPGIGMLREHIFSVVKDFGIYEGDHFIKLINENLPSGIGTFGDVLYDPDLSKDSRYRYKLCVVSSDIAAGRILCCHRTYAILGANQSHLPLQRR